MFSTVFLVLVNPKLRIKVPGPIAIFLNDFWNFENFVKTLTRGPTNDYQTASKNTRANVEPSLQDINFLSENLRF